MVRSRSLVVALVGCVFAALLAQVVASNHARAVDEPAIRSSDQQVYLPDIAKGITLYGDRLGETTSASINGESRPFIVQTAYAVTIEIDPSDTTIGADIEIVVAGTVLSHRVEGTVPRGYTYIILSYSYEGSEVPIGSWTSNCRTAGFPGGGYKETTTVLLVPAYSECRVSARRWADEIMRIGYLPLQGSTPPFPSQFGEILTTGRGPVHLGLTYKQPPAVLDKTLYVYTTGFGGSIDGLGLQVQVDCLSGFFDVRPASSSGLLFEPDQGGCEVTLLGREGRRVTTTLGTVPGSFDEAWVNTTNAATVFTDLSAVVHFTVAVAPLAPEGIPVGVPNEDVGPIADAGAVQVFPVGFAGYPFEAQSVLLHQGREGIFGLPEPGDRFGAALAQADFNSDGWGDLAIGAPGEDIGVLSDAGMVSVLYGGPDGFSAGGQLWLHQNVPGVPGVAEPGDRFGEALTPVDFNLDGIMDLAVGAPGEGIGARDDAGAVHVFYGGLNGLQASGGELLTQASPGVFGVPEAGDSFGQTLKAFRQFLVVGSPAEDIGVIEDAGMVHLFDGLDYSSVPYWQGGGALGLPEPGDRFGSALAMTDDRLVFGVPDEDFGTAVDAGWIEIAYYESGTIIPVDGFGQDRLGPSEEVEPDDRFGHSIDIFPGDGSLLAIGAPGEDGDSGVVDLWNLEEERWWNGWFNGDIDGEDTEAGDRFGANLNWSRWGAGLVVAAPGEDAAAGALFLTYNGTEWWRLDQDNAGAAGAAEPGDSLGLSVPG